MPNFTIFTELFAKLDHTVLPICDNHLITVDHRIPIGYNTFLRASRASSHDVTAIKKGNKIFSLACMWSIAPATAGVTTAALCQGCQVLLYHYIYRNSTYSGINVMPLIRPGLS